MIIKTGPIPDFVMKSPGRQTGSDRMTVQTQVTKTTPRRAVPMNAGMNTPPVTMGHGNAQKSGTAGGMGNRQMSGTANAPRPSRRMRGKQR
jgi:hypothetical protein